MYFVEARKRKEKREDDFRKANDGKTKTQLRKEQRSFRVEQEKKIPKKVEKLPK